MTFGEIKDAVRDGIGKDNVLPRQITYFIGRGRREIENRVNGHWMRGTKNWSAIVDQSNYSITQSAGGGLALANFKDVRSSRSKQSTETIWSVPHKVYDDFDVVWSNWATDDTGEPREVVIDNENLYLFPPKPDKAYDMVLYYWQFTANPTANSGTDFLTLRFPEALIFTSVAAGLQFLTKSTEIALPWAGMAEAELVKLSAFVRDRGLPDESWLPAWGGPGQAAQDRYYPYGRP